MAIIDLNDSKYEPCPFFAKGDKETLEKVAKELSGDKVSDDILEFMLSTEQILKLIETYPSLKVIGFVEEWGVFKKVLVVFSSVGSIEIDKMEEAGYFDGHDEDRWTWRYKPYEDVDTEYLVLNCGEYDDVNYQCPFKEDWND